MHDPRIRRGGGRPDDEGHDDPMGRGPGGPRGRGWGRGFGPPPGRPPRPPRPDDGPDGPPWGRGRARRGDIRTALLVALGDGPAHGYELIQRLEQRTGGRWRPSPGSVYPTLQLLEDEGLVAGADQDGKRIYSLTEAGATVRDERMQRPDGPPWAFRGDGATEHHQLGDAIKQFHLAARQVLMAGRAEQIAVAAQIVDEARKKLYQLLAEG